MTFIKNFLNDEAGASAAEYALILAVVGVAIGGASLLLANEISESIGSAAQRIEDCKDAAVDVGGNAGCPAAAAVD